jgi:hypothetical protein
MFDDQLTDYNDIDNDEEGGGGAQATNHRRLRYHNLHLKGHHQDMGKGEEYSDDGEDEAGNMYMYRQKIQAINYEL